MDDMLWCDCKTDEEREQFILSGDAYKTGIIAEAMQADLAIAYKTKIMLKAENEKLIEQIESLKCCGACKWGLHSAVTCMHVDSSFHGTSTHSRDICERFEGRST